MILFVGDKPSKRVKPGAKPFEGAAYEKRLKEWIRYIGCKQYQLVNSGSLKDIEFLCAVAANFYHVSIVALGNSASEILTKVVKTPHFKLPHPSGRNRQINDKIFIKKKLDECKQWLKSVK